MKGWIQESKRHSLARQGYKTGRKITPLQHEAGDRSLYPTRISSYESERNLIDKITHLLENDDTRGSLEVSSHTITASYVILGENKEVIMGMNVAKDNLGGNKWVAFIVNEEEVDEAEFVDNYSSASKHDKIFTKEQLLNAIKDQIESYQSYQEKVE